MLDHGAYIRVVEGSATAALLIHGIAGTPAHFRQLIPVLPENWSVYNILLDGHGKGVADFGASSMKKWRTQAAEQVQALLAQYDRVVLIAHSMGTLFSIQAALDHPDRIPWLFLLSVPTRPWVRFSTVLTSLRVARGDLRPDDRAAHAMGNDTSICLDRRLWLYLTWIPRLAELLREIGRVRKLLPQLKVPAWTFQSQVDELVSARSRRDLEGHPYIQNTMLYHSGHFQYGEKDVQLLQARLRQLIGEIENESVKKL